mgnify:CR=1 FL=1
MRVIIGADVVPTESNIHLFAEGNVKELLGEELFDLWNSCDVRIFNLEVPITDKKSPINKCGPNLIAPASTVKGIKALNPTLVTLANNHILDQGVEGFRDTVELLKKYGIDFIGAGYDVFQACRPFIIQKDDIKVGIYACAEHEFSIATDKSPGANPFDPLESLDHIMALRSECNYVIVLYHGGKEHYRYPSPYLQKVCRKIVEKGADLVICQHSHCIGCYEIYNGSIIVYGQGNFIFDKNDNEYWKTSLMIKVAIDEKPVIEYVPVKKVRNVIRLAIGKEADEILQAFIKRSEEILQKDFISQQYRKFAYENYFNYIRSLAGFGKWLSRLDRKLLNNRLVRHKYNKKQLLAVQNYVECESHRELFLQGLSSKIQEDNKI